VPIEADSFTHNTPWTNEASNEATGTLVAGAPLIIGQAATFSFKSRIKGAGAGIDYTSAIKPPLHQLLQATGRRGQFTAAIAAAVATAGTTTSATLGTGFPHDRARTARRDPADRRRHRRELRPGRNRIFGGQGRDLRRGAPERDRQHVEHRLARDVDLRANVAERRHRARDRSAVRHVLCLSGRHALSVHRLPRHALARRQERPAGLWDVQHDRHLRR
jgi:hypothetical protein